MVQPPSMEARRTALSDLKNIAEARSENRKYYVAHIEEYSNVLELFSKNINFVCQALILAM